MKKNKEYIKLDDFDNDCFIIEGAPVRKLLQKGAEIYGSLNRFSYVLEMSKSLIYRQYNGESPMRMSCYKKILELIEEKEKKRKIEQKKLQKLLRK